MTIQERVREAGQAKLHEPSHPQSPSGIDKDALYAKLLDPKSDWPEPAVKSDNLQSSLRGWLPSPPTSPGGTGSHHRKHKAGSRKKGNAGALHDEVREVNGPVGEFLEHLSPHGHAHTASGATGAGTEGGR